MWELIEFAYVCLASAGLIFFCSDGKQREADYLKSASRVKDLRGLSELLDNKTKPQVVAISGRVGSNTPFICEHSGIFGVFLEEKAKLVFKTRYLEECLLKHKEVPWFLEDSSGRVDVFGALYAKGFYNHLNDYLFHEPAKQLIKKLADPQDIFEALEYTCFERVLELGKPLTIVGEQWSSGYGTPTGGPFLILDGYTSLDKMISRLESHSQVLLILSIGLTAVGTLAYVWDVMASIKMPWFLHKSDTKKAGQRAEPDTKHNSLDKAQSE